MKKNLLLAIAGFGALLLSANTAKAQQTVVVTETVAPVSLVKPADCGTKYSTSWKDNWYLQLGAGMQVPYVDHNLISGTSKRHITAIYNVGVGHWFSPYLGFRITGYYGKIHTEWGTLRSANMANGNFDLTWDMLNSICGPKADRVFSIIPFVGVGGTYTWNFPASTLEGTIPTEGGKYRKTKEVTLPVSAGIQLRLRLAKCVDFFAEARANFYGDNFDNVASGDPIEANLAVYGGFNINFGERKYTAYNPCEYIDYINSLNNQINETRAALATTAAALAEAEAQLPCPQIEAVEQVVIEAPLLATVRFKINSARISKEEMVNVYIISQWMKANSNAKVCVDGYADKDTGTSAYNMTLSQKRAQAVVDALVNEYGIDPSRLTIRAFGSDEQPLPENNWNRIVIFEQAQ